MAAVVVLSRPAAEPRLTIAARIRQKPRDRVVDDPVPPGGAAPSDRGVIAIGDLTSQVTISRTQRQKVNGMLPHVVNRSATNSSIGWAGGGGVELLNTGLKLRHTSRRGPRRCTGRAPSQHTGLGTAR